MIWNLFAGVPLGFQVLFWVVFVITLSSFFSIIVLTIAGVRFRRLQRGTDDPDAERDFLWVFLVPALNEEVTIADSVTRLRASLATHKVVLVINDGSQDATGEILAGLAGPDLRVLTRVAPNARTGKAAALNNAYTYIRTQLLAEPAFASWTPDRVIVGVVDADGRLDVDTPQRVGRQFVEHELGGVQCRVRIYNRGSYLTWAQDVEFRSFGLVYQAGRALWGTANMGGNAQFNRLTALGSVADEVGPWRDRLTEDQDLGVRMLQNGWRGSQQIEAEVNQQGVPSLRRLYRQRIRWAQGAWQALGLLREVGRIQTGFVGRVDAIYYLLTPILQSVTGIGLVAALALWIFVGVPILPGSLMLLLIFISLGFGPGLVTLLGTARSFGGVLFALIAVIPYAFYSWLVYPCLFVSLARQAAGRTSWTKTARIALPQ